jgi:hypothetical protein
MERVRPALDLQGNGHGEVKSSFEARGIERNVAFPPRPRPHRPLPFPLALLSE